MTSFKEYIDEGKNGLWDNIHAKRKRIKAGSGEKMRKPGSKGAPTAADFKAANEETELDEAAKGHTIEAHGIKGMNRTPWRKTFKHEDHLNDWAEKNDAEVHGTRDLEQVKKNVKEDVEAQFDLIEEVIMDLAEEHGIDAEVIWEKFEDVEDAELLEYAIDAKGHKSSTGGLTQKGVDAYRRENPGSKLQTAVTTKPSKLKPGSKAANRRKSFCARMSGVDGPMKDEKGRPTRKALALRKWNC